MSNRSNNNVAAWFAGILGLIILGLFIYKLKRRRVVYINAELIQNTGDIEHV